MKNLKEVKTIIRWQVTKNLNIKILKIYQSIFIYNLLKNENITNYNCINIPIKVRYFIDMQKLISKLIYLLYSPRSEIFFAVRQLSKYNADP